MLHRSCLFVQSSEFVACKIICLRAARVNEYCDRVLALARDFQSLWLCGKVLYRARVLCYL